MPEFDGLRGVLSVIVVAAHANLDMFPWVWGCMDIFFCLSGYLITSMCIEHGRRPGFLGRYFLRRVLRTWPLYFVVLAFVSLFGALLSMVSFGQGYVLSLCFLQNIELLASPFVPALALEREGYPPVFDHSWSIALEEQFYIAAPLLVALLSRCKPWMLCLLAVFGVGFSVTLRFSGINWWVLPARLDGFIMGAILAVASARTLVPVIRAISSTASLAVVTLAVVCLACTTEISAMEYDYQPQFTLGVSLFSALAAVLIGNILFAQRTILHRTLAHPFLIFLGDISYSTYLWHLPVIWYCAVVLPRIGGGYMEWLMPPVAFVLSFLCSYVSNRLIERPFQSLKRFVRF